MKTRDGIFFVTLVTFAVFSIYGQVSGLFMLNGTHFGRYEIRSKLGEGGMGEVYAAHDAELDRSVAIKLLPNEFTADADRRSRFRQEARVVSALNHPNIITIYEVGENELGSFLATEYVEGRTLRDVAKSESLTLVKILRIVEQAANALVVAHAANIVHRDIKPENIMVRSDLIVKVLDFGLAKPGESTLNGNGYGNKTMPGTVMGSSRYMSPEQARGLEVDERTDIWSLGVVIYELLMGHSPFAGETTADTLANVIHKEPEPIGEVLPNIPVELQRILRKALQKDREMRYQSMKDLALDIKDLRYELEHVNSGERVTHISSSPNFSENPTMIHTTTSANHRTNMSIAAHSQISGIAAPQERLNLLRVLLTVSGVLVISALIAAAAYNWLGKPVQIAASAFEKTQISRINTDGKVQLPAISPDGKYVAYVSGEIGNQSLVVRQVATDSMVTVVPPTNLNFSAVTFSPSGDHIYYCQTRSDFSVNTLYQVPTLGGTSKKLIEDVDSSVTFSPDGKQFAFMRHVSAGNDDIIFSVDSASLVLTEIMHSKDTGFDFFSNRLAWSPDGKVILIGAGKRETGLVGNMSIAEISVAERTFKVINQGQFFTVSNFVWLADGSGFICSGREAQNSAAQIWRTTYPAIKFEQVTNDFNDYAEIGLANDGKTIVTLKGDTISSLWRFAPVSKSVDQLTVDGREMSGFSGLTQTPAGSLLFTQKRNKTGEIWIADNDGKNVRLWLDEPGFAATPVTSPDGRYVVFNRQKDYVSRIWRADADGKNAVQLTESDAQFADFNPQITADGKMVIFQRQVSGDDRVVLMRVPIEGGASELFHSSETWSIFQPRISTDGKRIAFSTYDLKTFKKKLQIATLVGNQFGIVERDLEYNLINQFKWAPDSRSLTILTSRSGTPNIWNMPIDGSEPTPITDFKTGRIFNFAWDRNGKGLLLSRGNTNNDLILIRDTGRSPSSDVLSGKPASRTSQRPA